MGNRESRDEDRRDHGRALPCRCSVTGGRASSVAGSSTLSLRSRPSRRLSRQHLNPSQRRNRRMPPQPDAETTSRLEDETRDYIHSGEIGLETRGLAKFIRGYAIVFDQLSGNLGFFREKIASEAVDRTLREGIDLRALVDHEPRLILGRMEAKTLRVEKDTRGLRVEIEPDENISYAADIMRSVGRRDVTGMSFAFRTLRDMWDETTDPPTRTVLDMVIREVSVVTFPAYPQTDVALRSLSAVRSARSDHPAWTRRPVTVSERMRWSKIGS